jgi:phage baseplate assembly protein W
MAIDEGKRYGRGFNFPPGLDAAGRVAWSVAAENVRQSIRIILLTEPQERIMLPEFGAGLKRFLFRPNTVATHRLIQERITVSLGRWERRVQLEEVRVERDPDDETSAIANIRYKVIATDVSDSVQIRIQLTT